MIDMRRLARVQAAGYRPDIPDHIAADIRWLCAEHVNVEERYAALEKIVVEVRRQSRAAGVGIDLRPLFAWADQADGAESAS